MCCAVPFFSKLDSYFWKLDCNWAYFCVGGTVAAFPVVYLLVLPLLFFATGLFFGFAFPIRTNTNANPTNFLAEFLILRIWRVCYLKFIFDLIAKTPAVVS